MRFAAPYLHRFCLEFIGLVLGFREFRGAFGERLKEEEGIRRSLKAE